jgi:hypothetical protein
MDAKKKRQKQMDTYLSDKHGVDSSIYDGDGGGGAVTALDMIEPLPLQLAAHA